MAHNPWLVPITTLKRSPGTRRAESRSGRVGELAVAGTFVPGDGEVSVEAILDAVAGGIEVSADVSAPWKGECRRCLKPVDGRLTVHVRELYRPHEHNGHAHRARGEHQDHQPHPEEEDEETYPLRGEMLDLQPLVRDSLLLELPLAPLCSDDCRGLCPTCGADLNESPCGCTETPSDPRWAALEALKVEPGDG